MKATESKIIGSYEETESYFINQKRTDIWKDIPLFDIHILDIPAVPLCVKEIKETFSISASEDIIQECMSDTQLCAALGNSAIPLRETSILSLKERTGAKGFLLANAYKEGRRSDFANIINFDFHMMQSSTKGMKKMARILIRDGQISCFHSDEYAIMPISTLLSSLKRELDESFSGWEFICCETSYSMTICKYKFTNKNNEILKPINIRLVKNGCNALKAEPILLFSSSDTAESAATLYPMLWDKSRCVYIQVGNPLGVRHKGEHPIKNFDDNCGKIFSLYQNAAHSLETLAKVKLKYPLEVFKGLAATVKCASKEAILAAFEEFDLTRPARCSALDVYLGLWAILTHSDQTVEGQLNIQENIHRIMLMDESTILGFDMKG